MKPEEIKRIAKLAHIQIKDNELQQYDDLKDILKFANQLNKVDTTHIKPMLHPLDGFYLAPEVHPKDEDN